MSEVRGGARWLAVLPQLAADCVEQWSLEPDEPLAAAAHSLVLPAGELVLKINFPGEETEHEADALECWDGRGAVRLFAHDRDRRALLIERCRPGTWGWALRDEDATAVAGDILERLWIPASEPFTRLEEAAAQWEEFLPRHWKAIGRPYGRKLLDRAVAFLREAGPTQRESLLLHQDFHGGNFLLSERGWLAIDAKPLVGEREFDVASLIRDRRPATRAQMLRRLDYLVERLSLDRERALGWAIAHALAWDGSRDMIDCARELAVT